MKKGLLVLSIIFFISTSLSASIAAEMAKEGDSDYTGAMSWSYKSIPMEKERVEWQFEVFGVVVNAKEDSPLYNATFYALGELHALKGSYQEKGFVRYTRPDGDQVFATYDAEGSLGGERKIKASLVGGTGKCSGITGGGEWRGVGGLRPPKEGVGMSVSIGKYNWRIP